MLHSYRRFIAAILCSVFLLITCGSALAISFTASTSSAATRVYSNPSASGKFTKVGKGVKVTVKSCSNGWAKVSKNGKTGYVKTSQLKPGTASKLSNAVAFALMQAGKTYGYSSPKTFNCSSLINYCYKRYGYRVKGTSKAIAADDRFKKITSISSTKLGDILCFDTNEDSVCDHVAISLGGSTFLEASQSAKKVQTNRLSTWYRRHFMWARRVA